MGAFEGWGASGGGGAPATLPSEIGGPFGVMMIGEGPSKNWGDAGETTDWDGTVFAQNPSVMRWIVDYALSTAVGNNPYTTVSAYDPDTDIAAWETELGELQTYLDALAPETDVETFLDAAAAKAGGVVDLLDVDAAVTTILNNAEARVGAAVNAALNTAANADLDTVVDAALANFRARHLIEHETSLTRFEAGMSDINAVNGSAFVMGLAVMESNYDDRLAQYDAEFTLPLCREAFQAFMGAFLDQARMHLAAEVQAHTEAERLEIAYIDDATRMMLEAMRFEGSMHNANVRNSMDSNRMKIIAKREEDEANLEYDVEDVMWDAEVFQRGANVLSAASGAVVSAPAKPSRIQSGLGGALAGAAVGEQYYGHWGGLAGAIIGGTAGYYGA